MSWLKRSSVNSFDTVFGKLHLSNSAHTAKTGRRLILPRDLLLAYVDISSFCFVTVCSSFADKTDVAVKNPALLQLDSHRLKHGARTAKYVYRCPRLSSLAGCASRSVWNSHGRLRVTKKKQIPIGFIRVMHYDHALALLRMVHSLRAFE
jgi:hypothetical protein